MPVTHIHRSFDFSGGEMLKVELDQPASVWLLEHTHYLCFIQDRPYEYIGKEVDSFPYMMKPPGPGAWDLVIMAKAPGVKINASIEVVES